MDDTSKTKLSAIMAQLGADESTGEQESDESLLARAQKAFMFSVVPENFEYYRAPLRRALMDLACAGCLSDSIECENPTTHAKLTPVLEDDGLQFHTRPCPRLKRTEEADRIKRLISTAKLPQHLEGKGLRAFQLHAGNQEAAKVANELARDQYRKGAIFWGPPGVGKTHLAVAILVNRVRAGISGVYATVPDLLDSIRGAIKTDSTDEVRRLLRWVPLLILDDMGAEKPTDSALEEIFKLLNGRLTDNRQTIVTTNFDRAGLSARLGGLEGARIVSRLSELCDWVEVQGDDKRVSS